MQNPEIKPAVLFADSARGIYIPQFFGETAERSKFTGINAEQWEILEAGPDHSEYWDAWQEALDNAETECGGVLFQDGDLWILWPEQAIDAINELCESMLEYETRHPDAGDAYAHMVAESWCDQRLHDFLKSLNYEKRDVSVEDHFAAESYKPQWKFLGVDSRWKKIDPDTLANMALESFVMRPGHIFGPYDGGIVLDSFPVQEIEIDLSGLGIDGITLEYVRESCEAYISGTDMAYVSTDAVWYALLDVEAFNCQIENHFTT